MKTLAKGQFYGQTNVTTDLNGVTLTDTEYTHEKVDWHYHENAYFTLILQGRVIEGNKKQTYHCPAGTLLFHNWQEAHYNIKPEGFTRGFHIEIDPNWLETNEVDLKLSHGSINVSEPRIKIQAYNIFREAKINDNTSPLAIHSLLINVLSQINTKQEKDAYKIPGWVYKIREVLNDDVSENRPLISLAQTAGIHPVHLSRDFQKYFGCNLGSYIRSIKVQQALSLLSNQNLTLTDIAFDCGFADQSHFIRCFKAANGVTPSRFRDILLNRSC